MRIRVLIRGERGGRYTAYCPALPGCVISAGAKADLEHKVKEAVAAYLASMDAVTQPHVSFHEAQEQGVSHVVVDDLIACGGAG